MELAQRDRGDELLQPGEMTALRRRLRAVAGGHDLVTVIACAFDHRTRMLPFFLADTRMVPAGVRAIGSAMVDSGFVKTRIVLQQWNRNFRPSRMRLDGRVPDLFLISSMQIHSAQCKALIADAWGLSPPRRPLIVVGGPKAIYEPWDVFSADPGRPASADVAVRGEEYVLLRLLEVLLAERGMGEPVRAAFLRVRDAGALDGIPGLVYARTGRAGHAEALIDTGPQRLLGDLDELPHPILGYRLLEPPSRQDQLASSPLPPGRVRRCSPIGSLVMTLGCKFRCPYCPIPAYNQRQFRCKSGARIAEEMVGLHGEYGLQIFFGADDNFFNDPPRAVEIAEVLAATQIRGAPLRRRVRWGTEVTVHDTLAMKDDLRTVRKGGLQALWLGVEDMSGALIRKGQGTDQTLEAFRLLRERGIFPMPMLMHHDAQPLYSRGRANEGLINQVRLLRKAGAISLQVLMITPSPGSRLYEEAFTSGMVYEKSAGRRVEPHMFDGNYVVASRHARPWRKQLNILAAYLWFYNPIRFLWALVRPKSRLYLVDPGMQVLGMLGLVQTARRTFGWALRLIIGPVARNTRPPGSRIPYRHGASPSTRAASAPCAPKQDGG